MPHSWEVNGRRPRTRGRGPSVFKREHSAACGAISETVFQKGSRKKIGILAKNTKLKIINIIIIINVFQRQKRLIILRNQNGRPGGRAQKERFLCLKRVSEEGPETTLVTKAVQTHGAKKKHGRMTISTSRR